MAVDVNLLKGSAMYGWKQPLSVFNAYVRGPLLCTVMLAGNSELVLGTPLARRPSVFSVHA